MFEAAAPAVCADVPIRLDSESESAVKKTPDSRDSEKKNPSLLLVLLLWTKVAAQPVYDQLKTSRKKCDKQTQINSNNQ